MSPNPFEPRLDCLDSLAQAAAPTVIPLPNYNYYVYLIVFTLLFSLVDDDFHPGIRAYERLGGRS